MAYRLTVPFTVYPADFEETLDENLQRCREADAHRIFYVVCGATAPEEQKQLCLHRLQTAAARAKAAGFEVGCWLNSLGHGGPAGAETLRAAAEGRLTLMRSLEGTQNTESCCPLNENFRAQFCDWVGRLAAAGVKIIQLDDDFRYSWRGGERFCCCDDHIRLLEAELGERFDAIRMKKALTEGGPNRWRSAWLKVQGETLLDFARLLRTAVDRVDPTVRLTACAVLSTWDVDGVDALSLSKAFAGNTKPLLRLIGAPYWAGLRNYDEAGLAVVCEYERLQLHWATGTGIETMTEGDSHPNNRYNVPAAYAENFDRVLRAAGEGDGILKYMFYGEGYHRLHLRSRELHRRIHECFDGRRAVGLTIFEPMKTLALSHEPGTPEGRCIPASLRFVTDNSLPVRYDTGEDAAVIFGDAAECAGEEQFAHGAILDAAAAQILARRGFDVGVTDASTPFFPGSEEFLSSGLVGGTSCGRYRLLRTVPAAETLSVLHSAAGDAPGACRYENAKGQRFLVFAFEARHSLQHGAEQGAMRGWNRAAQVRSQLAWLSGREPDAVCDPAPDLYMLVKKSETGLSIGLWNFSVDEVETPTIRLNADWSTLTSYHGSAVLDGRTVTLEPLPAFGCAFFTLHNET